MKTILFILLSQILLNGSNVVIMDGKKTIEKKVEKEKSIYGKLDISKVFVYSIKSNKEDIRLYKSRDMLNEPNSSYLLGLLSLKDGKYTQDLNTSFKYLYKAANNGHSESQRIVGLMNYFGIGTEINLREAKKYMSLSYHNNGNMKAQDNWNEYKFYYIKD